MVEDGVDGGKHLSCDGHEGDLMPATFSDSQVEVFEPRIVA